MGDEVLLTDGNIAPMQEELFRLYSQGFLTDITLSCEDGKNFEAHRVLLAARSAYFYGIVPKLKVEPVIFLKGVKKFEDTHTIISELVFLLALHLHT